MPDVKLNAEQLILLQNYENDLPSPFSLKDVENCGDTLLAYLLAELAEDGDTNRGDYIRRLETARKQIDEVLRELAYTQARDQILGAPSVAHAAVWFVENVPFDVSWRDDAFHHLRARMLIEAVADVQVQRLIDTGYWVQPSICRARWQAWTKDGVVGGWTNTPWEAWALAQEHFNGVKIDGS